MNTVLIDVTENFQTSNKGFIEFSRIRKQLFGNLGKRGEYIWQWVLKAAEITTLLSIDEEIESNEVINSNSIKMWGVVWDVLVDDIADEMSVDKASKLLPLILDSNSDLSLISSEEQEYIKYAHLILESIFEACKNLPGYETHKESFFEGYLKLNVCMNYSLEIREDISQIELEKYKEILSHNMHMVINGIIDLMRMDYPIPIKEEKLEEALLLAQRMGRIGNATTTFKREIEIGDYSSEIIAVMLSLNKLQLQQLSSSKQDLLNINYDIAVEKMWNEWEESRLGLEERANKFPKLKMRDYINGLIALKQLHLQSEGRK